MWFGHRRVILAEYRIRDVFGPWQYPVTQRGKAPRLPGKPPPSPTEWQCLPGLAGLMVGRTRSPGPRRPGLGREERVHWASCPGSAQPSGSMLPGVLCARAECTAVAQHPDPRESTSPKHVWLRDQVIPSTLEWGGTRGDSLAPPLAPSEDRPVEWAAHAPSSSFPVSQSF